MNVSAWSIKNPIPAAMLFVMLTLAGLFSFQAMKVQNFPDLDVPNITIVASLPGAAPNQLENDVARKLENSLASLQGLKHIYTKVQDGTVSITAEFRIEKEHAGGAGRRALGGGQGARRPADRPARTHHQQAGAGWWRGAGLHRPLRQDGRRGDLLVRRQRRGQAAAVGARRGRHQPRGWRQPRGADPAGPAQAAVAGRDRGRHLAPAGAGADRKRGRPGRHRRQPAAPAHAVFDEVGRRTGRARTLAVRWSPHPAGPDRDRQGHHRRTHGGRFPGRQAGGRLRSGAQPRRQRGRGGPRRARQAQGPADGPPGPADHRVVRLRDAGRRGIQLVDDAAVRGRHPGGAGGLAVPARLSRHGGLGRGAAAVGDPGLHRHALHGLHHQRGDAAGDVAGGRHPGGRRHRRGGKHRAPHAHGQVALPGRHGSGRRDRHGGDRHHLQR